MRGKGECLCVLLNQMTAIRLVKIGKGKWKDEGRWRAE